VQEGGETVFPDSPTRPSAEEAAGFSGAQPERPVRRRSRSDAGSGVKTKPPVPPLRPRRSLPPSPRRPPRNPPECAKKGLGVKASRGDALLFFSLKPDGTTSDSASLHAGCPVIKGTKWIATKVGGGAQRGAPGARGRASADARGCRPALPPAAGSPGRSHNAL
jgi:hypothetical protein